MVALRPVVRADLQALFDMELHDDQWSFVARNATTLAEARFEDGAHCFSIWLNDQVIGMLACIDFRVNQNLDPGEDTTTMFLWRFMIDRRFQHQGLGRAALNKFLDWSWKQGVSSVSLEVVETNANARKLYESFGFKPTGRMFDDEVEYKLAQARKG